MNKNQLIQKLEEFKNHEVIQYLISLCPLDSQIYLSGGFIRDLAAGKDISMVDDLDFLTCNIDCQDVAKNLAEKFNGKHAQTEATVYRVYIKGLPCIDLATSKNKLLDINKKLAGKDFTVNSFAYNLIGESEFLDPFNGLEDIRNKTLKLINENEFKKYPKAILRGFRFIGKMGFQFDEKTTQIIKKDKNLLNKLPINHARHCLIYFCKLPKGSKPAIECLKKFDCLYEYLPEFYNKNSSFNHDSLTDKVFSNSLLIMDQIEKLMEHIPQELNKKLHKDVVNDVPYYSLIKMAALFNNLADINPIINNNEGLSFIQNHKESSVPAKTILTRLKSHSNIVNYVSTLIIQYRYVKCLLKIDQKIIPNTLKSFSNYIKNNFVDVLFFTMAVESATAKEEYKDSIIKFYMNLIIEELTPSKDNTDEIIIEV